VLLEPDEKNDLLWSSVEQFDFTPLEEKASDLRTMLLKTGWTELQPSILALVGAGLLLELMLLQMRARSRDRSDEQPRKRG
jgi:hypothetical protein